MTIKQEIKKLIINATRISADNFSVEIPNDKNHGDYSTNVALVLAKKQGKSPVEMAETIKAKIKSDLFSKTEIAGPGFINFFVKNDYFQKQLPIILKEKDKFGNLKIGINEKINVEFVSANPTGPLTLGNGRGGFGGDVLASVLSKAGYKVKREYYINDTGNQIKILGHSILGDSEAQYKGKYIADLKKKVKGKNPEEIGEKASKIILEKMIKPSLKKMGIKFDNWFSEKSLYKNKEVDKAIEELSKKGFTYESEGAVWFKSKNIGDDKDRVLIRSDGIKTYFASDIAYLKNKFKRGFNKSIIFLGADHYGYVARIKAASHALGFGKDKIDALVLQLVRLFEKGKEVRMSKRAGIYVTIDELIDEIGLDVARFFFLQKALNTQFNFDLSLAKEKSEKNPVFKVQYAYARICSILRKAGTFRIQNKDLSLLKEPAEIELIKHLIRFSEIIEDCAKDYQLQRIPQYSLDLSDTFHKFYEKCQVISEDKKLTQARLSLISATKIVLKNTLDLMGISAPEKM
jgi:arginyl-tRNA synthetase